MKNYITYITLLICISSFAQKEAGIWYFGDKAGLDFSSGSPVVLTDGQMKTAEGCASISDSNGNLLFYTDGISVWNRNHQIMSNGTGLLGDPSSTQSGIIVPKPGSSTIYYVFTVDEPTGIGGADSDGLNYSEVDISLNGGLGDINNIKNINLLSVAAEKVNAVLHQNGEDIWVISHGLNDTNFYAYLVTSSGINNTPVVSSVGSTADAIGVIKVSPNGRKLVICNRESNVELFDFNNNSGVVSNPRTVRTGFGNYGAEFSSTNQFLYVSSFLDNKLYQYDTTLGNISISEIEIYTSDEEIGQLQLGPDGKIYIAYFVHDYLGVINKPDVSGIGCDYNHDAIFLSPGVSFSGLPTFIQSYFFTVSIIYENTCFGDSTNFSLATIPDSVSWNFGDPTSGVNNTSTLLEPTHIFTAPGTYTITATATLGVETTVETETITIYDAPIATQPTDMLACDDNNDGFFSFNLRDQDISILNGQDPSIFTVTYFASQDDFDNNNLISDPSNYLNDTAYTSQTIVASIQNNGNSKCNSTTTFDIQIFESPTPTLDVPTLAFCDDTSVGTDTDGRIEFDLTQNQTVILNGQSESQFIINYFTDSGFTNQILDPSAYQNTNPNETIYVQVVNNQNSSCTAQTSFNIEVFELPEVTPVVELKQCDDNLDGFSVFNLTEVYAELSVNYQNEIITFYELEAEAENGLNPITNTTAYTNQTVSTDMVWARIENPNTCYRTAQLNLTISTTQIPNSLLREFYQCDDGINITDGIATFDFSSVDAEIQALFPAGQQLIINYYRNQADALSENNPIADISNYQNIGYLNSQDIYVRVDSELDNDCLGLGHHITLHVETVPVANAVTIPEQCDADRDGLFAFDTSMIESTLLNGQTNVSVSYTGQNGNVLPSPLPNPFITASQTINVRVENATSLDLDGACYDETTIEFTVIAVPIANSVNIQEQCDDDFDGFIAFDTSTIESALLGSQTGMIVEYTDESGTLLSSPLPNPFVTNSQTITARVINPQFSGCYGETLMEFIVRKKPDFELQEEAVICITDNPQLEVSVQNPNGNYSYQWTDEFGTIISSDVSANIMRGGTYRVVATSSFGCSSDPHEITIVESAIAVLNDSEIVLVDDSNNNSININIANLGIGDYEFSLLDEDLLTLVDFQDSPFFDNLEGGVYTVLIRDKNGCGVLSKEISLITFPKFFTPNNDGVNDTWKIKGITRTFYQSGKINIFNRYGKHVANFSIYENGWDGLYNNKILPSNDYWFVAELLGVNGRTRIRKGNFSLIRN